MLLNEKRAIQTKLNSTYSTICKLRKQRQQLSENYCAKIRLISKLNDLFERSTSLDIIQSYLTQRRIGKKREREENRRVTKRRKKNKKYYRQNRRRRKRQRDTISESNSDFSDYV
ncbi:hypothetical protein QE152_g30846 [Popillia japonica]|uniref:Uncharacterized protein n=1 Tax=Popillia japonica TaxID=7064 RepID=A0AAW1JCP8_POPJA